MTQGSPSTARQATCRTLNKISEVVYVLLGFMPFGVAVGLVVAALWSLSAVSGVMLAVAAVFAGGGYVNVRRMVLAPATELRFDLTTGVFSWKNRFRSGDIQVSLVARIESYPRQPSQYRVVLVEGAGPPVPFWFSADRRPDVECVVDAVAQANPAIDTSELYERRLGWPGLRPRGSRPST